MRSIVVPTLLVFSACATTTPTAAGSSPDYQALVNAPDRTADDRQLDLGRKPTAFLSVLEIRPGMKIGELISGGGYTTELLARAVAPRGVVYGENPKWVLDRFAEKPWTARLKREVNQVVVRVDRELDSPFPPELDGQLDVVVTNANYHDLYAFDFDTAKLNAAVYTALKPGGRYVVADSSAKPGTGSDSAKPLHRIDELLVRKEVEAAGFKFLRSDEALRNPDDTRDWNASPAAAGTKRGTSDRFLLVFVKP